MPSPYQFTYFQGAGFDASLLSFLQIDRDGCVNVSKLGVRPHVTAGAGGFVDITAQAKQDRLLRLLHRRREARDRGRRARDRDARARSGSSSNAVEHVSFSGRRAVEQGQDITYVTERCVMRAGADGVDGHRDRARRRSQARHPRPGRVPAPCARKPRTMDAALFSPEPFGLVLGGANG